MVDTTNPTSQFHPYQPQDATPHSESLSRGGLGSILSKVGMSGGALSGLGGMLNNTNVRGSIDKMRASANKNPGMVLGGLAALVIGAGLMRKRRHV